MECQVCGIIGLLVVCKWVNDLNLDYKEFNKLCFVVGAGDGLCEDMIRNIVYDVAKILCVSGCV